MASTCGDYDDPVSLIRPGLSHLSASRDPVSARFGPVGSKGDPRQALTQLEDDPSQ